LAKAPGEKGERPRWGKSAVLKTFFPELRPMRTVLARTLPAITGWARRQTIPSAEEFGEWVCAQAQLENKRAPQIGVWRKLLRWLPQLMPTLEKHIETAKAPIGQSFNGRHYSQVSLQLLAGHMGVSPSILQRAMETSSPTIGTEVLRGLIERIAAAANSASIEGKKTSRRSPGPYKTEAQKTYFQIGASVEQKIPDAQKNETRSIVVARQQVANETRLEFDVVAQYHKRFRRFTQEHPV
jgi:hypothetical protein